MNRILFMIADTPVTQLQAGAAALALILALGLILLALMARALFSARNVHVQSAQTQAERQREIDEKMAALARLNAELAGRMQTMAEVFGSRQSDFARLLAERLDSVSHRVGQGLESSSRATQENLGALNERLALIDAAQTRLAGLTQEVVGLKDILANKQTRGAFGQGRMEAIVRDGLPANAFLFQPTLSNGTRPDCAIRLPGDDRLLVVDAKFPLEAFTAFKDGAGEAEKKSAAQRVRADVSKHVKDIADRYFLPGETQDIAILFVPSESLFAELHEHFDDVVQKAHRARVLIVSPSLLTMAIQVMQAIVRDARVREQAHAIMAETRLLVDDVVRLRERVGKLETHFRQAGEDIAAINVSAQKIGQRGERIDKIDFAAIPDARAAAE